MGITDCGFSNWFCGLNFFNKVLVPLNLSTTHILNIIDNKQYLDQSSHYVDSLQACHTLIIILNINVENGIYTEASAT